jgi:hypothetical protein
MSFRLGAPKRTDAFSLFPLLLALLRTVANALYLDGSTSGGGSSTLWN